jgi:hypothetical protein
MRAQVHEFNPAHHQQQTYQLMRHLTQARVEARLEQEAERAFEAWVATKSDLPGPKWEHVHDPLYAQWQGAEQALALVRCL